MRVIQGTITELDIESAGLSMLIQEGIISEELFLDLKDGDKDVRNQLIGKIQINNEECKKIIGDGIKKYVDILISSLRSKDSVLEMAKDAVFTLNDIPDITKLDDYVNFVIKNVYYLCVEFPITKTSKTMVKIYKNREGVTVRFATLNKNHPCYPLLYELLDYCISGNSKLFYRTLTRFKSLMLKNLDDRLINNVPNDYLYEVIENIM